MTRGTFYLYTGDTVYESNEFNGDMYRSGHGEFAAAGMKAVKSLDEFINWVRTFNKKKFGYPAEYVQVNEMGFPYEECLDMSNRYFEKFFSDYLYIKNMSGDSLTFRLKSGSDAVLPDGGLGVLHFGDMPEDFTENEFIEGKSAQEFPGVKHNAGTPSGSAVDQACELFKIRVTEEEKKQVESWLEGMENPSIYGVFYNAEEFGRNTADINPYLADYFNFKEYGEDVINESDNAFMTDKGTVFLICDFGKEEEE